MKAFVCQVFSESIGSLLREDKRDITAADTIGAAVIIGKAFHIRTPVIGIFYPVAVAVRAAEQCRQACDMRALIHRILNAVAVTVGAAAECRQSGHCGAPVGKIRYSVIITVLRTAVDGHDDTHRSARTVVIPVGDAVTITVFRIAKGNYYAKCM